MRHPFHHNVFSIARRAAGITGLTVLALPALSQSEYDPGWARNFRLGMLAGFNIKASFRMSGTFPISGAQPGFGSTHNYDDGYVRPDVTGDPGLTWNWGIENASQWDAANSRLLMHRSTAFQTSGSGQGDDAPYLGMDLAYGGVVWHRNFWRIGWELGFGYLPIKITDNSAMSANVTRSTYAFSTGGNDLSDWANNAPYHGNAAGPGPEIENSPTFLSQDTASTIVSGTRILDVTLYTFRLGPTLYCDLSPYVGVQVGAGPALGLVSGNLKFNERLNFSGGGQVPNIGSVGSSALTYGGYVNALVTFHLAKNGDLYIGAQYMPMGKARIGGGGREAELDLKGQVYISAGINWPF